MFNIFKFKPSDHEFKYAVAMVDAMGLAGHPEHGEFFRGQVACHDRRAFKGVRKFIDMGVPAHVAAGMHLMAMLEDGAEKDAVYMLTKRLIREAA